MAGVAVAKIITAFVINVALSYLSEALSKKPRDPGLPPVNVTVNDTVEWRHLVVGTRRVGGSFVDIRTSGGGPSSPNKFLWYVIAYADHQCHALKDAYFDEFVVPSADIDAGTGVVSTSWANSKIWIWSHLGTQAQTADAQMVATFGSGGGGGTAWSSTDRLRGVCYRVIKMERDDTAFPTGAPDHVSSIVEGALKYDPRKDSTNGGSGAHRMDNPSTWEFESNWALGVLFLATGGSVVNDQSSRMVKYGIKEDYARIDWPFWIAAANLSDQLLTGTHAPGGDEVRYALNAEFTTGQERKEILDLAIAAGAGELVYVHGKWRLYGGAYDTPVHSFTQDDLRGDMDIEDTTDEEERVNRVSGIYVDPNQQWKEQTSPYRFNAAYDTQDQGREFPKEIDLRTVTSLFQVDRICELELRKARQMRRIVFRFGRKGMKVAPQETFYFSHSRLGWVNREFRCVKRKRERSEDGGIITVITTRSEAASMYADLLTADYSSGTSITNSIQSEAPEPPTSLVAIPHPLGIEFQWSLGAFWTLNGITELWEATTDSFGSATKIWEGKGTRVTISKSVLITATRYYWVRMRTIAGQVSATEPATNGVQASPLPRFEDVFNDSFEHQDYARFYNLRDGSPTITYPLNGEAGGPVIRFDDYGWIAWKQNIPYDPTALYVMTVRARLVTAPTNGQDFIFAGVEGVAADGTTLINVAGSNSAGSQHYFVASGFDMGAGASLGVWQTFRGYLSGLGSAAGNAHPDITAPEVAYSSGGTVVKFIRPLFIANYNAGDGIMEVDYIRLEKVSRTADIEPGGVFELESVEDDSTSLINGGGVVMTLTLAPLGLVEGYLLQVTATFDVWITAFSGGTPEFFISVGGGAGAIGVGQSAFPTVTTSPGQRITLQLEIPIELADEAGSGVIAQVAWTGAAPAGTAEMRNGAMRCEKLKR